MKFIEVTGDLFDTKSYTEESVVFAQCISSDFVMSDCVATKFIEHFDMKEKLVDWSKVNAIPVFTHSNGGTVKLQTVSRPTLVGKAVKIDTTYNLITKELTSESCTIESLEKSLKDMKNKMMTNGEHHLAITDMICSDDSMDRNQVVNVIRSVFLFSDITVYAVKLKDIL